MANLRPMLLMGLAVLAYMMWLEWQKDYAPEPQGQTPTEVVSSTTDTSSIPAPEVGSVPNAGDLPSVESSSSVSPAQ